MAQRLILITLAFFAFAAVAAQAQPAMGPPAEQRFQMMDRMMEDAQKSRGPERHKQMQQHMQAMQEQMQNMRPMMRGMQPSGQVPMGPAGGPNPAQMQERMDMMQRMMEQMLKNQEMMLNTQER